jgi:hypothetical protein
MLNYTENLDKLDIVENIAKGKGTQRLCTGNTAASPGNLFRQLTETMLWNEPIRDHFVA